MKNIKLKIQYDGTNYCGWQKQKRHRTIQGEVERVLSKLCNQKIETNGTSRTDSGVHAYEQIVNFQAEFGIPVENIKKVANKLLPDDIVILSVEEMPLDFHARYSAVGKKYIYKILNTSERNVFLSNYYFHVHEEMDASKMMEAARFFEGTHDFKAFMSTSRNTVIENTIKTICRINVDEYDRLDNVNDTLNDQPAGWGKKIHIEITGNSFLYNMVRIISGTLVDVGTGKIRPEEIEQIILNKDRRKAGYTAPPGGLYLKEIYFNKEDLRR